MLHPLTGSPTQRRSSLTIRLRQSGRLKRFSVRPILLFALMVCLTTLARSQAPAITPNPDGSVTIDASRLTTIIELQAPWRFSPKDDPRFADPSYDDSNWPLIRPGMDRTLAAEHVPDVPEGQDWARLHIHIRNADGPLAVTFDIRNAMPYSLFANGKQISASKGFASEKIYWMPRRRVVLPQSTDFVLALHIVMPGGPVLHYFPIQHFDLGQNESVRDRVYRDRHQEFNRDWFSITLLSLLFLAVVPIGITLFLAQRERLEYLWLSVFCLLIAFAYAGGVARNTGILQGGVNSYVLLSVCRSASLIASLEFAASMAQFRRRSLIRLAQTMLILNSLLLYLETDTVWIAAHIIICLYWPGLMVYILVGAWRRGRKECGFLFFPMILLPIPFLLGELTESHTNLIFSKLEWQHLGVGFALEQPLALIFLVALMAVVLYRFIRVSKDEEVAAAELEAARTVQQLLIPSISPDTPGFIIESVYLPARQVGGDFFLILPSTNSTADKSLLAVIGDVSGKGLQAAMVVSTIIGGLRMQLSRQPAEVLAHLNRVLTGHVSGFSTCCAILLHPDGRALLANAGNPSPYCDGEELPTSPGLPLGLTPDAAYDETVLTLAPGSRLTFVSDGVVEATSYPRKELFGFDRTRAISHQSAAAIAEAACAFGAGAPQADDITVLTIALAR